MGYKRTKYLFIFCFLVVPYHFIISTLLTVLQICHRVRRNANKITKCYLKTFPLQFMQGMVDFELDFAFSPFFPLKTVIQSPFFFAKFVQS